MHIMYRFVLRQVVYLKRWSLSTGSNNVILINREIESKYNIA